MPWPISHLTEQDKKLIHNILKKHEPFLRSEIQNWPKDGCPDTCSVIIDDLRSKLGNKGFRWKIVRGWFCQPGDYGFEEGHVWIEIADGTIIDPTAGQFMDGPILQFFEKGDEHYLYKRR